jgi:hypothetical protein
MNATNQQLEEIAQLAETQRQVELKIALLEADLETAKDMLNRLSGTLIPDAMMAVGMESFKLSDGTTVKVEKFYSGKIPEDKANAAFAWLRGTGNDSLIKRNVTVNFGKGEDEKAEAIVAQLRIQGLEPVDKQSVHPMTLKSFIREQLESGSDFPSDLFGAYVGNKTKIVAPKKAAAPLQHDKL